MATEEEFQAKDTVNVFNKTLGEEIPNSRKRDT